MSAAATTTGRDLIDRAVAWMGGAARLDAVSTLVETATQVQKRAQGEVKVSMKTMWRFPGEVRSERTMERSDGPAMSFATVLTPEDMFSAGMGRVFPIVRPGRSSLEMDFGRHPLAILRARRQRDFTGAALGPAMLEGIPVEQVRVVNGAVDAVLGIEPKSGQLHSVTFTDRNLAGEVGTCTVIYSDFRDVAGIRLPHQTRSLFNGEPDGFQTWTVQSIQIDLPLDPALFTRPPVQSR
jgi:hypothetical protein